MKKIDLRHSAVFGIACLSLAWAACAGNVSFIPSDASIAPEEEVHLRTGPGIKLTGLGVRAVEASQFTLMPGSHRVHFDVRKSWKSVDEYLDGVYSVGSCSVDLKANPGDRFRITSRLGKNTEHVRSEAGHSIGARETEIQVTIHLENENTGEEWVLDESICPLRLNCKKMDRSIMTPSSECTYD